MLGVGDLVRGTRWWGKGLGGVLVRGVAWLRCLGALFAGSCGGGRE